MVERKCMLFFFGGNSQKTLRLFSEYPAANLNVKRFCHAFPEFNEKESQ